ncbi:hypothetical protein ACYX78_06630 [Advenella incenata]
MTKDTEHPISELIAIAAKAGIGLLPGGGLLTAGYEGLLLLSQQADLQMERRSKKRYDEFVKNLFEGKVSPEVTEYLTADDYMALLFGCMKDMENEKAKYYGRLAAAIGRGEIKANSKRFIIITLSQLSEQQLQMLRKSFIASQFSLRPSQGSGQVDAMQILQISDPIQRYEYNELVLRSLYSGEKLSDLAKDIVRACFDPQELQPTAIGHVEWRPKTVDIIFDSKSTDLPLSLINACWASAIRSSNRAIHILDRPVLLNFANPHIMIMESDIEPDYLPTLKARMKNDEVLFVCYYNHEDLIRTYFPDSVVINVGALSTADLTEEIMTRIKMENGWVS